MCNITGKVRETLLRSVLNLSGDKMVGDLLHRLAHGYLLLFSRGLIPTLSPQGDIASRM